MPKTYIHSLALVFAPVAAFTVTLVQASPVQASPVRQIQSREVAVSDLDLATAAGQQTLRTRINKAARAVCGMDEGRAGSHIPSREAMACYRDAQNSADQRIAQATTARLAHGG